MRCSREEGEGGVLDTGWVVVRRIDDFRQLPVCLVRMGYSQTRVDPVAGQLTRKPPQHELSGSSPGLQQQVCEEVSSPLPQFIPWLTKTNNACSVRNPEVPCGGKTSLEGNNLSSICCSTFSVYFLTKCLCGGKKRV